MQACGKGDRYKIVAATGEEEDHIESVVLKAGRDHAKSAMVGRVATRVGESSSVIQEPDEEDSIKPGGGLLDSGMTPDMVEFLVFDLEMGVWTVAVPTDSERIPCPRGV